MATYRVGIDIGGTFTDFVLHGGAEQSLVLHKKLTTPHDPSAAAIDGVEELVRLGGIGLGDVSEIIHGTTLVTNAVIERKGAKIALLTTRGFRDILEQGIEQRYDVYDLFLEFPDPLVPRDLRFEVNERITRDGEVIEEVDREQVRAMLRELRQRNVEAVAVCLINAYRNPEHERIICEIAAAEFPELAVSLSSEVVPELGEYPRCVTTCANAYAQPLVARYLKRLDEALRARGFEGALRLMHSAGGLISPQVAAAFPVRLLESGPAGGALATSLFAGLIGRTDMLSFDMGGTTAKASIVEDGKVAIAALLEAGRSHRFKRGSGLPVKVPVIDMIEIGAGGGSIASIDEVGLLKVGPHSAGSDPGPVCYGGGGTEPTVTDANLALGYYDPNFFLGGRMKLDRDAAVRAIQPLAALLGTSVDEAAWGIHKVVVESMAAAARIHLIEKGKDPRHYAMLGFGGAGPAHAADVARVLGVREVIIPPASGAASAVGFLAAPLSFEMVKACPMIVSGQVDLGPINAILDALEADGRRYVVEGGSNPEQVEVERFAEMRLVGQIHTVTVGLPEGRIGEVGRDELISSFTAAYTSRYTAIYPKARIEIINLRVRCSGPTPAIGFHGSRFNAGEKVKVKGTRRAWFESGAADATVYDRYALVAGDRVEGPAIIEEREATTIIPPGDSVVVDEMLNLRIAVQKAAVAPTMIDAQTPREEAVARIEADPIALEVMWSRLVTVTQEMSNIVISTAFSSLISDVQDFACDLLDQNGDTLAYAPTSMPGFNLTLPRTVKAMLEKYPAETLKPGDVLITNDPWLCAGHLYDFAIVTPIFLDGTIVALAATVGDTGEVGGTKDWRSAREIYEEGIQVPVIKLFEEGRPNETLVRMLEQNVRKPIQVLGDIHSLVAANAIGGERLLEFMRDYGMKDLRALSDVVQRRSERAMRDAISAIPDGTYEAVIENDRFGATMRYPVRVTISGDAAVIDFEGAPPQVAQGGYNCVMNYTQAEATYPFKCLLTPGVRGTAGCYRPFTVLAPENTILNANYPASLNFRARTGWYIAEAIFHALAKAMPDQVQAATGLPFMTHVYGKGPDGQLYYEVFFMGAGQGGSAHGDGKSGLIWPSSAASTSIELFESRVSVLVLEKMYVPDSGGAGKFRGGLGSRVRYRKLRDDGEITYAPVFPEGVTHQFAGLFGGRPSGKASARITDGDGNEIRDLGLGERLQIRGDDVIVDVVSSGGAGYGNPLERRREMIERDLRLGLITPEGAKRDYGYVPDEGTGAAAG